MKAALVVASVLTSLILSRLLLADEGARRPAPPELPAGAPSEQVEALIKRHEKEMTAFRERYEKAKTEDDQEKLVSLYPDPDPFAKLLVEIAEKNPKDPAAVDALVWAVDNGGPHPRAGTPSARAKEILIRDHLQNPKIGPLCRTLRWATAEPGAVAILRRILADNPSKDAQAQAALSLARLLQAQSLRAIGIQKAKDNELAQYEKDFGKECVAQLKKQDVAAMTKEVEDLLDRIKNDKDYAATTIPTGSGKVKLGELAGRELFEIRHLQPGKPAPEIVGEDIDGKGMKLSDFRGKVVLLDFWGHW